MIYQCPDCGFTHTNEVCPRCGGTAMIPLSLCARLWRRITRCWIVGHTEPRRGRKNQYGYPYAHNYCAHCGTLCQWPADDDGPMDWPEYDLL